jgi:hypothetical protein
MTQSVIQIVSSSLAPGSLLRIIIFDNMICMYLFKNIHIHVECIKPSTKTIHGEARYHHISILRHIIISFHTRLQQKWEIAWHYTGILSYMATDVFHHIFISYGCWLTGCVKGGGDQGIFQRSSGAHSTDLISVCVSLAMAAVVFGKN